MTYKGDRMTITLMGTESTVIERNSYPAAARIVVPNNSISSSPSYMKQFSLLFLTLQNVTSILLLRYVRTTPGPRFINSTAVFNSEIQKTVLSILLLIYEQKSVVGSFKLLYRAVICNATDTLKTGIPALLYTLQNNLLFVSISNLDAATFQVSFQLKIFTTAIFTVLLLRRQFNLVQWLALFLLFLGISLVQIENMTSTAPKQDVNAVLGFISVVSACILSGLAGVYFEKILKGSDTSVWIRNIQLGIFGILFGFLTVYLSDGTEIKKKGFLFGYTNLVWTAITIQSAGGLLVALVVKYADNIWKGFATSAAIIISCIISMGLFDFQLTVLFAFGTIFVIFSIFLYSTPDLITHIPIVNVIFKDKSVLF
ncbi:unnamed protein product [Rotaria magnacalcarata]|uniref:UDP-N-acetylglucosamine transporter n=1 Tax=Rotaria magnacalcarata TaxID=392030 RepID=A0A816MT51_9BILA|nr:unnamed protein product [Rotaria magnacalcarata]CAF1657036.1 unnamed protein product [Rotaria magnacalcarata]CAF2025710.1 unnamed protein product [Rotaria magnacalcarata]CAF2146843.1 unnamed protein product [Rotaria magnacalcarata]CAF3784931.1 unnamed protein product [Rotaria magnacalcarata]